MCACMWARSLTSVLWKSSPSSQSLDWLFYPHCRSIIHRDEDHTKCFRISKVTSEESKLQVGTGHSGKTVFSFHSFKSLKGWQWAHMAPNFTTTFLLFTCLGLWLHANVCLYNTHPKALKKGNGACTRLHVCGIYDSQLLSQNNPKISSFKTRMLGAHMWLSETDFPN